MKKLLAAVLAGIMGTTILASCGVNDDDSDKNTGDSKPATKVIDIDLTQEEYAFGVDKDQPELLEQVNTFIAEIMENGKFDEICNKYFADGTPTPIKSAELDEGKDQLVVATNAALSRLNIKTAKAI